MAVQTNNVDGSYYKSGDVNIPSGSYSVAFWYRNNSTPQGSTGTYDIVWAWASQASAEGLAFSWDHDNGGSYPGAWTHYNSGFQPLQYSSGLVANTWLHIAVTFDGTTRRIYLNGTESTNDTPGTLGDAGSPEYQTLFTSTDIGNTDDGELCEVAVWDGTALTAAQMEGLASGNSPLIVAPQGLTNYWPLYTADSSVKDLGSGGLTMTKNGTINAVPHAPINGPNRRYFDLGGFSARRNLILDGLVAQSSPSNGWNDQRANIPASSVRKVSNKEVVVTLPALAGYSISADETVDTTLYARALKRGVDVVGPTFTLEAEGAGQTVERSAVDRLFASDSQSVETESGTPAPDLTTSTRYVEIKNYP